MDNEYKRTIDAALHYPQSSTLCCRELNDSEITDFSNEDERVTVRLRSARTESESAAKDSNSSKTESKTEILIEQLCQSDQILIETAASVYVFTIIDPVALSGKLIGGILGNRLVEAYLLSSCQERGDSSVTRKSIKSGAKFIFVIEAGKGLQRLTTSAVKSLRLRKRVAAGKVKSKRRVTLEQVSG